jgi:hypothetical protein
LSVGLSFYSSSGGRNLRTYADLTALILQQQTRLFFVFWHSQAGESGHFISNWISDIKASNSNVPIERRGRKKADTEQV